MFKEVEELKQLCEAEIMSLKQQIKMMQNSFFLRWNAKATIQVAEAKVAKIQELLVKLETLSEQVTPVVMDIKELLGIELHGVKKGK
ncbi:hypothetical protein [Desulfotomaculum sp. 1211_IL3151]|uniref:hypothetical protein n=1 Tax=Desulfotomaculum sp. 1211_IL3151 TaxID=3084055 RepID=UPI002FD938E9